MGRLSAFILVCVTALGAAPVRGQVDRSQPLWTRSAVQELVAALRGVAADGLDPDVYRLSAIEAAAAAPADPAALATLDVLCSDAFARVLHDLRHGRVPPDAPSPDAAADDDGSPLPGLIRGGVAAAVDAARPHDALYRDLVAALARLRGVATSGGWGTLASGPALRLDSADARVPALRRRLVEDGDLAAADAASGDVFDPVLERAVRSFQHRHALTEDGVVGPATLAELNVPVEARIRQVRASLERARWVLRDLPSSFVAVNVAGARVYLVREGVVVFETRAVVGKVATETPTFRATVQAVELNPYWNVPPGIVKEVLAAARKDPSYLARESIRVLDDAGREVHVSAADLRRYTAATFPWRFRQDPGPLNPLGRVKLVLPNRYNVYLHDTPAKQLFQKDDRAFSHGCIRVQDALTLASRVLADPRWTPEALEAAIAEGDTRTLPVARPLPVLVLYWTASTDFHGQLHFYRDIYGRDAPLLQALDRR